MKHLRTPILAGLLALWLIPATAQDDLLSALQKEAPSGDEKVIATFKGTKLINLQTTETVKKRNLDFRVSHLFGNVGEKSGGGVHNLYGLDQSADIRIWFTYGITDRLNVAFSRFKRDENLVGEIRYRLLEQTVSNSMPFSLLVYGNMAYTPKEDYNDTYTKPAYRISYVTQAVLSRKFSRNFSFELVPSLLHRNLVASDDDNNLFSLGAGARYKFTRSASIVADYVYTTSRPDLYPERVNTLGVGLELETGGHVFTLMFTNASGLLENDYIANTTDTWADGGFKLSFHISRMFSFAKK
jgi:hypothetical protein